MWDKEYVSGMLTAIGIKGKENGNIVIVVKEEYAKEKIEKVLGKAISVIRIPGKAELRGAGKYLRIILEYKKEQMKEIIIIGTLWDEMIKTPIKYRMKTYYDRLEITKAFWIGFMHYGARLIMRRQKRLIRMGMVINSRYSKTIIEYIADLGYQDKRKLGIEMIRGKKALTITIYGRNRVIREYLNRTENESMHKKLYLEAYKGRLTVGNWKKFNNTRQIVHGHRER